MKTVILNLGLLTLCLTNIVAQDLKTFSGPMKETIYGDGKATFTYYEKDNQQVKHGKFSYEWTDNQTEKLRDKNLTVKLNKKISGSYKNGRKDGVWTFVIDFTDYKLDYASSFRGVNSSNIHSTGLIAKTVSYKEGKPHGNWTYKQKFKSRYINPIGSYSWNWSNYDKGFLITVDAQFKDGVLIGNLIYNDDYSNESANIKIDNDGFLTGNSTIKKYDIETSITIKDKLYVKDIETHPGGRKEVNIDLTNEDLSLDNYALDTSQFMYLNGPLKKFNQFMYFNQTCCISSSNKKPLIDGCDFYEYGLKGGYTIDPIKTVPLDGNQVRRRLDYAVTEKGAPLYINEHFIDYETKKMKLTLYDEELMIRTGIGAHINDYKINAINRTNVTANNNKKEFTIIEILEDLLRLKEKLNQPITNKKLDKPTSNSDIILFNKNIDEIIIKLNSANEKRAAWLKERNQKIEEMFSDDNYSKNLALDDGYLKLIFDRLNKGGDPIQMYPILWLLQPIDNIQYVSNAQTNYFKKFKQTIDLEGKIEVLNNLKPDYIVVYWGRDNGSRKKNTIGYLKGTAGDDFLKYAKQSELFLKNALVGDVNYIAHFSTAYLSLQELEYNNEKYSLEDISKQLLLISDSLKLMLGNEREKSIILSYDHILFNLREKMTSTNTKSQSEDLLSSYGLNLKENWLKLFNSLSEYKDEVLLTESGISEQVKLKSLNDKIIILSELLKISPDKINEIAKSLNKEIKKSNYELIWTGISESLKP